MKKTYLGISIETDKDKLLSTQAAKLLKKIYYCIEGKKIHHRWHLLVQLKHIVMVIQNLHNEFTIMFLTNGLCLHHLYCQMHLNQNEKSKKHLPISCFSILCARHPRRLD